MEPVDYEMFLADLETKRALFNTWVDSAIQNVRQVLAAVNAIPPQLGAMATQAPPNGAGMGPLTLSPDAFFGLGIGDAAVKYLQLVKRQQSTREIAEALTAANYPHTSRNFVNTVNT